MTKWAVIAAAILVTGAALGADSEETGWNQWRGPRRDGTATGRWPVRLDEQSLVAEWRVPLPSSYSGPVVVGDRVFVTGSTESGTEIAAALDRTTGEELWRTEWEGAMLVPFFAMSNGSWIRSTPACDGDALFVGGMRDVLICLDVATGAERWRIDFVKQSAAELPAFGFVASPLVIGDHVYVQAGAGFVKVEKRTGRIVWHTLRDGGGMNGSAFSSPVLAEIQGVSQLVVQTRTRLAGVDPETGDELWSQEIPAFRGMNILTPTVVGDRVFTSSYGGGSFLFAIDKAAGVWSVRELWRNKVQAYMSSPIVIDGHVYLHLRNQRFACLNLETGLETWISRPFGKYWSLIANDRRMLALDERGELLLLDADPAEFRIVDARTISSDPAWAHLAACDGQVFIRELNALAVYRWRPASEDSPSDGPR
ncbi:MAG: PQQ-like beta-propeller repeat protein [Planctomyces sp.]|nr:PQQ-like beta-propeller repeat protein [Planctomyces sp.]